MQALILDAARRMQPLESLQDGPQSLGRRAVAPRRLAGSTDDFRKQYACRGRLDGVLRWKEPIHIGRRHRHGLGNISHRRLPVADPAIEFRGRLENASPRFRWTGYVRAARLDCQARCPIGRVCGHPASHGESLTPER
nr:hypothetical protein [Bradyrhizobium sp.]